MTTKRTKPFHRLRVAEVRPLCDDAAAVTFAVPDDLRADFSFRPGQSLTLRKTVNGREERRSYSICSPPGGPMRIGVREVPGGTFSEWLVRGTRRGDEVDVQTPSGSFAADPDTGGRHVLIAAGSGITPIMSIAATLLRQPDTHVVVIYGNRRTDSVMFADELADLKDGYGPRLELIHVLSREQRAVDLFSGRLDADRIRLLLRTLVPVEAVDHFWLCGPHGMVEAAQSVLHEFGVSAGSVHQELFFVEDKAPQRAPQADAGAPESRSDVTIILDGRATTLALPRDTSVLEGAQRSRDDLPFACKGGVCGTCRARVTAGTADMRRNYALEPDEVAVGFVLTCQTFPASDAVTIDFDA
ncbi:MAG TPA: 1,2-phenylacetyl-CoA epoxidase subunit PaaE [Mycobacterium sp.]|nr:1,2-phenylacetyl-CoA epoxidase subunit PaaE [Mycobacterium sp.]